MKMDIFQIKTKPHGIERVREFIDEKYVCIGWPGIGNLEQANKDEIRCRIQSFYKISGHKLGNSLGQVNTFVNTMKKGDVVFITHKDRAHIGIVGDYKYQQQFDNDKDGMCHRRSVEWINNILICDLESSIQRLLSNRNTICQYPETIELSGLDKYLSKHSPASKETSSKLEDLFKSALMILEEELKSTDPDRRLKAASELIRLKNNA
jgi:predicted Mrr-cat superfamily restriction endonuclease